REREFKVTIKFAARKELDHLRQFLAGRQQDNPQETIQALDVVLRESASKDREIVGRSLFLLEMGSSTGKVFTRAFDQHRWDCR
ncbi:PAZ domain-containing protein, partial [Tanacetum coccineum]